MGIFSKAVDSEIRNLNVTNCKYILPYTNEEIWNKGVQIPLFVGQILGYGENVTFTNIFTNVYYLDNSSSNPFNNTYPINNGS